MDYEVKNFSFEVKATNDNEFEGYASVFRNIDSYRDVIEPGAFAKTIQEGAKRVKVLWQHDPYTPIGVPTLLQEDNHGLYVKAKISQTALGKDVITLMKDGVINELSIGFNTVKDEWDNEHNVRRIKEVKLWEFSPVTFAANDQAMVTSVKNNPYANITRLNAWVNDEIKAGRVLSEKNRGLVKQAIEALEQLYVANEPTQEGHSEAQKAASDIMALIQDMKNYANN